MRIGIITFHASHNYGSMLQAWALQTYLEQMGHVVEIVNYRSKAQRTIYHRPISFMRWNVALASIKRLLLYPSSIKPLNRKWELFEDFMKEVLHVSEEYHLVQELEAADKKYDLLICGSDQIWNTGASDSGDVYYGNWFHGRKIAYAASLGQSPECCDGTYLRVHVKGFDGISVREERSRGFLEKNGVVDNIAEVCDPTLLLEASQYAGLVDKKPLIDGDYIFFYTPVGLPHAYFRIANTLGKQLGCKVITDKAYYPHEIGRYENIQSYIPIGPREFLNLIKNAKCVCGGSFHLQVFSILFRKDFYCINGDKDSRTGNLLKKLGLERRIVSLDTPGKLSPIVTNYPEDFHERLTRFRQDSIRFIQQNVSRYA